MPSRLRFRRLFKGRLIHHLARGFNSLGFKPNQVTLISPVFAIFAGISLFFAMNSNNITFFVIGTELHALFLFLLLLFDGIDGALARLTNSITIFGGYLDSNVDRFTDFLVILGYLFIFNPTFIIFPIPYYFWVIWILLALIGFYMVSYSRGKAESQGLKDVNIGLAARAERLMLLFAFSFLLIPLLGLIVATLAANATAIYRIIKYLKDLDR